MHPCVRMKTEVSLLWDSWLVIFKAKLVNQHPSAWAGWSHISSLFDCLSISSFTCGLGLAVWLCSANLGTNVCTRVCWETPYCGCRRALGLTWEAAPPVVFCSQGLLMESKGAGEWSVWGVHELPPCLGGRALWNFRNILRWFKSGQRFCCRQSSCMWEGVGTGVAVCWKN